MGQKTEIITTLKANSSWRPRTRYAAHLLHTLQLEARGKNDPMFFRCFRGRMACPLAGVAKIRKGAENGLSQ